MVFSLGSGLLFYLIYLFQDFSKETDLKGAAGLVAQVVRALH